jgi:hypothetical protein
MATTDDQRQAVRTTFSLDFSNKESRRGSLLKQKMALE